MASPVIEGTADSNSSTSSTSFTVNLPTGIVSGEGILVAVTRDGGAGTVSFPAGYTELYDLIDDDSFATGAAAWKQSTGGEPASITVTSTTSDPFVARAWRISGATDFTVTPPDFDTVVNAGNTTTHDPPNVSVTGGSNDILIIPILHFDTYTASVSSFPSGYGNTGSAASGTSGSQCEMAWCDLSTTAASENPGAYTLSTTRRAVTSTIIFQASGGAPAVTNVNLPLLGVS